MGLALDVADVLHRRRPGPAGPHVKPGARMTVRTGLEVMVLLQRTGRSPDWGRFSEQQLSKEQRCRARTGWPESREVT